jgi:hypothetical protein
VVPSRCFEFWARIDLSALLCVYTFSSGPIVTSLQQRSEYSFKGKTTSKNFRVLNELKSLISLQCQLIAYILLLRVKEQRNILHEIRKRNANWIGHILRRNCLLQRVTKGKIKEGIEVTGRRGRRRRKLLDDLKKKKGYSHLKEEALDCNNLVELC